MNNEIKTLEKHLDDLNEQRHAITVEKDESVVSISNGLSKSEGGEDSAPTISTLRNEIDKLIQEKN